MQILGGIRATVARAADMAGSLEGLAHLAEELAAVHAREIPSNCGRTRAQETPPQPPTPPRPSPQHLPPQHASTSKHPPQVTPRWVEAAKLLRKQQNQGGLCLIKVYLFLMQSYCASAARHSSLVEARACADEVQQQLLQFSQEVIAECAAPSEVATHLAHEGQCSAVDARLGGVVGGGGVADLGSVAAPPPLKPIRTRCNDGLKGAEQRVAGVAVGDSQGEKSILLPTSSASDEVGTPAPELRRWSVKENAAVVCAGLKALSKQGGGSDWVQELMPALCALMRCGDRAVRDSIADILESVVWPRLEHAL
jgi:hypothetical protein